MKKVSKDCKHSSIQEVSDMGIVFNSSLDTLEEAAKWLKEEIHKNPINAAAGATPFLNMFGWTLGGWIMCKSALKANNELSKKLNVAFNKRKIETSMFYCSTYLPISSSLASTVKNSYKSLNYIN